MVTLVLLVLAAPLDTPRVEKVAAADGTLTCSYYAHFMVKELTGDAKGALSLSFAVALDDMPGCSPAVVSGETVLTDWTGYFAGATGDWVIFNGDDGWNGGMPFAIYDTRSGKRLFEGVRGKDFDVQPDALVYRKVVPLECNASVDKACAAKGQAIAATREDVGAICKKGYAKNKRDFEKAISKLPCDAACKVGRKEQMKSFMGASSVLEFDGALNRTTLVYTPKQGGRVACLVGRLERV